MYVKIKTDNTKLQEMPMAYRATWDLRNDEPSQAFVASHDGWLIKQETPCPTYDPETQAAVFHYEQEGGYAVQKWEIRDMESGEDDE